MKELCRKCNGVLFEKVLLNDQGLLAMSANKSLSLISEGEKKFFLCPHCGAKNIVISSSPKEGIAQMRISHAEE